MHISLLPPSSPPEARVRRALLEADLAWLGEELAGAKSPEQKASILYQLGLLELLAGRDSAAVRQLLASVNSVAHFKEPLERLIVLIERHRSFKNLPTLLEHLCRTAEGSEEVARARLALAWCAVLHAHDDARALPQVEAALLASPHDPAALLTLELLARRAGNGAGLRRALEARLEAATHPTWAALIGLELADLRARGGDAQGAYELLCRISALDTRLGFRVLARRIELGGEVQRSDWMIESLEAQTARLIAALQHPEHEARELVPLGSRTRSHAVDALLTQAELERGLGRNAAALATLERARLLEPEHPLVARALLEQAVRSEQHALAEKLLMAELAADPTAPEATALWLELCELRLASQRSLTALAALQQALALDPRCWVARARELDLLCAARDPEPFALALEQVAQSLSDGAGRGRHWLLAADVYARHANRPRAAQDALEQAAVSGVPLALVRRLERALAHAQNDRDWYRAATLRLLATDVDDSERVGLELEAWRHALLAGDGGGVEERLALLERSVAGRRVALLARAYCPGEPGDGASRAALERLFELEPQPVRAAALGWALGLRADGASDREGAIEVLARVHASHPGAAAVAGTLSAWLSGGEPLRAAAVLRATAAAIDDEAFASSLLTEAGLGCWWAGQREVARQDFEAAERPSRGSRAGALSAWARRASRGFSAEPEPSSEPEERLLGAFERATRAGAALRELNDLNTVLRTVGDAASPDLVLGARLGSLVLSRTLGVRADPIELERAASTNADFGRLSESFRYLEQIGQAEPSPRALEESTRVWSDGSGGLVAALEWAAAAARLGQRGVEHAARARVSDLLSGVAREHARAGAALVAHISQSGPAELLDGRSPEVVLTNLETSPPGCDPRRRVRALEAAGDVLGAGAEPIVGLLRGYNQLAMADVDGAIGSFRRYTDAFPDDPSGWEGLLSAARGGDDPALLAEAAARLGNTCRDPAHAARLFEEASEIFFERLGDEVAGQAALSRAVQLDPSRASSFSRLYRSMRDSASPSELLGLLDRRLPFVTDSSELIELSWERARACRREADLPGALAALELVIERAPDHVGALALFAEIYITTQRHAEAVDRLERLAGIADAPAAQRLTSGLMAVDLCENQLGASERALAILATLDGAGLGGLALRERWARSAARSGAWDQAVSLFERLMLERSTPAERAEAARLALVIHRDERRDPGAAGGAAKVLLDIIPDDAEALDIALSGALPHGVASELLSIGRGALIRATALEPTNVASLTRLASVAEQLGDIQLRQATVGALVALGHGQDTSRAELVSLERRISTIPPQSVPSDVLAELADPEDKGPVPELLALVAPYLAEAFGPPRHAFALSRRERISARSGDPLRDEIAAWVNAFTLSDFDLYLSPVPSERLVVLGTEPLTVIAGASVVAPLGPFQRLALARSLYAAKRGISPVNQLEEADVMALVAALCSVAGVELSGPVHARQRDFEQKLVQALPRKARKRLHEQARPVRDAQVGIDVWVRAATASLDRVGAVAVGDASVILADAPSREGATSARDERARRLLSFMLSPEFEGLRQRFGVTVR